MRLRKKENMITQEEAFKLAYNMFHDIDPKPDETSKMFIFYLSMKGKDDYPDDFFDGVPVVIVNKQTKETRIVGMIQLFEDKEYSKLMKSKK